MLDLDSLREAVETKEFALGVLVGNLEWMALSGESKGYLLELHKRGESFLAISEIVKLTAKRLIDKGCSEAATDLEHSLEALKDSFYTH